MLCREFAHNGHTGMTFSGPIGCLKDVKDVIVSLLPSHPGARLHYITLHYSYPIQTLLSLKLDYSYPNPVFPALTILHLPPGLQGMLHRRLGNEQSCSAVLDVERRAGTEGSSRVPSQGLGAASCSAGNEGQSELEPRIARVARKLASKKWVVLYDSLKTMFMLQAEGIARGVVFEVLAAGISVAVLRAAGKETEARRTGEVAELDGLRRCVRAWEAYKDWGEEVRL